jgi:hypothetical protein
MSRTRISRLFSARSFVVLAAGLVGLAQGARLHAEPPEPKPAPKPITINSLSLEVNALQTLRQLQPDKEQLEKLRACADEAIAKDQQRKPGTASAAFREKMAALRKALQEAKDADLIAKLNEEVGDLREKEKPVLDDGVDITDAARKRAPEAYRLLKVGQIAAFLGQVADSVEDPVDRLVDAFEEVRTLNEDEWKEHRAEIAADVARLAAGLDPAKAKRLSGQIDDLLARARGLSKAEFQARAEDLSASAQKIVGGIAPEVLLRNHVEVELATLLSNPRTPHACQAMLKLAAEDKAAGKK